MKNRVSVSAILNLLIIILTIFSTVSMMAGFNFMDNTTWEFSATRFESFKYFTIDSNVFAGIVSIIYLCYITHIRKKNALQAKPQHGGQNANDSLSGTINFSMPKWLIFLKLAATTSVMLTFMVTACFLAPTSSRGFFALFKNSNFFFHFVIPVLCIVSFIFFEPSQKPVRFSQTLTGIIPMFIYSLFYTINILLHLENGQLVSRYDWYGFLGGKISNVVFVLPAIYLITWIFSLVLWLGNKRFSRNSKA